MRIRRPFSQLSLCRVRMRSMWMVATVALTLTLAGKGPTAAPITFFPGSLIIPMDTSANGQDAGMLRAYGLVYELLRNNVPVYWVINPAKPANGNDVAIGPGALEDVRTGAPLAPRSYRGGPFVIADADGVAALPIIQAWQASVGDATAVHRFTLGSFTPDVARLLVGAPRIAILQDGNEVIAFNNLNAAGIRDALGGTWTAASPDLLTEGDIAGPTTSNHADGALLHQPSGLARYCTLLSMHYNTTAATSEVVHEVRSWLTARPASHAFMQCQSTLSFENHGNGLFLTTAGLVDDGAAPTSPAVRVPSHPLAQIDGAFTADIGSADSIGLQAGSVFDTGVQTLVNDGLASLTSRIVLLTGPLDGIFGNGQVTYLTGHDYSVDLPISTNPQTNGVRLFLNSIFESGCATEPAEPDVALTMSAPAAINGSTITYTIAYTNPGSRPAERVRLTDTLPAGTTFASATGGGSHAGGVVTWNLAPLGAGAAGSVSVTVTVPADGTYTNSARMRFSHLVVRAIASNSVTTVRDTEAPTVSIPVPPNVTVTSDSTPSFFFTASVDAVATQCRIDANPFVPCASPFTAATPLADGFHLLEVRAVDAAGNLGNATRPFVVDTIAPAIVVTTPASGVLYGLGSSVTPVVVCTDTAGSGVVACTSPTTLATGTIGPNLFTASAVDAAGNMTTVNVVYLVGGKNQCKGGGWAQFVNPTFTNQGQCVNAVGPP